MVERLILGKIRKPKKCLCRKLSRGCFERVEEVGGPEDRTLAWVIYCKTIIEREASRKAAMGRGCGKTGWAEVKRKQWESRG